MFRLKCQAILLIPFMCNIMTSYQQSKILYDRCLRKCTSDMFGTVERVVVSRGRPITLFTKLLGNRCISQAPDCEFEWHWHRYAGCSHDGVPLGGRFDQLGNGSLLIHNVKEHDEGLWGVRMRHKHKFYPEKDYPNEELILLMVEEYPHQNHQEIALTCRQESAPQNGKSRKDQLCQATEICALIETKFTCKNDDLLDVTYERDCISVAKIEQPSLLSTESQCGWFDPNSNVFSSSNSVNMKRACFCASNLCNTRSFQPDPSATCRSHRNPPRWAGRTSSQNDVCWELEPWPWWVIMLISLAVAFVLLLIIFLVCCCVCCRRKDKKVKSMDYDKGYPSHFEKITEPPTPVGKRSPDFAGSEFDTSNDWQPLDEPYRKRYGSLRDVAFDPAAYSTPVRKNRRPAPELGSHRTVKNFGPVPDFHDPRLAQGRGSSFGSVRDKAVPLRSAISQESLSIQPKELTFNREFDPQVVSSYSSRPYDLKVPPPASVMLYNTLPMALSDRASPHEDPSREKYFTASRGNLVSNNATIV